jgi:hypothetical protein
VAKKGQLIVGATGKKSKRPNIDTSHRFREITQAHEGVKHGPIATEDGCDIRLSGEFRRWDTAFFANECGSFQFQNGIATIGF